MFVSHSHNFVLVTPARCGSRFLHSWIRQQPEIYQPEVNKMIDQDGGWIHHSFVPGYASHYPVVMTVRPPRDRLLSIWHFRKWYSDKDAWPQFLERQRKEDVNIWFNSFFEFSQRCRPTYLIRLTHLRRDLASLPMLTGVRFTPPEEDYHTYDGETLPAERERDLQQYIATDLAWLASRNIDFDRELSNAHPFTGARSVLVPGQASSRL